ncbi:MAG: thioredoxin domain-containing protein [Bacteroidales bacterium]|nr:thioredoxin domain-containing protein [Bacteroidales bacterium]
MNKLYASLFICCLSFFSCTRNAEETVAFINNRPIKYNEIDKLIQQELFDALNNIYYIRKIALEDYISKQLMLQEATQKGITIDSLIKSIYQSKMDSNSLFKYAKANGIDSIITEFRGRLYTYKTKSKKGYYVLQEYYKKFLLDQYIDSLKQVYKVKILLKPPQSPTINANDFLVHYKGNLKSCVSFIVFSDFECDMCRQQQRIFDSIYYRYKDFVRFGFVNYGSYVSMPALASECAAKQGKFWEFHDAIFSSSKLFLDSTDIHKIAKMLKLDLKQFWQDYNDHYLYRKLENNLMKIREAGIYGTPTIMINGKLIYNSSNLEEILNLLNESIKKNK